MTEREERERDQGWNNQLFRVLSEERQGRMPLYQRSSDYGHSFSELFPPAILCPAQQLLLHCCPGCEFNSPKLAVIL
ncbi:hypothetical protein QQF64_034726 [Cirrhinus molitorella]|uniref:Uncharacterized protein n=1 Tax=Cirrhinus molitorella TaxID=172907 RepID=A0ABR3L1U6_9TELE